MFWAKPTSCGYIRAKRRLSSSSTTYNTHACTVGHTRIVTINNTYKRVMNIYVRPGSRRMVDYGSNWLPVHIWLIDQFVSHGRYRVPALRLCNGCEQLWIIQTLLTYALRTIFLEVRSPSSSIRTHTKSKTSYIDVSTEKAITTERIRHADRA